MLVGHGTVRKAVMGYSREEATDGQIAQMQALTARAMEEGAFGISTGLIYPPSCYSTTDELVRVVSAVAPYGGYYATHMRNESFDVVKSVEEALHVAKEAGVRLQISHHKVTHKLGWQVSCKTTIAMIQRARRQGLDVCCDQYPYRASATSMSSNVPSWAFEGGVEAMLARLRDPETRAVLQDQSNASHEGRWCDIYVAYVQTEKNQWMVGKSITEIAEQLGGKDPADTCFDIVLDENNHVGEINFGMCEENTLISIRGAGITKRDRCSFRTQFAYIQSINAFIKVVAAPHKCEHIRTMHIKLLIQSNELNACMFPRYLSRIIVRQSSVRYLFPL
jgi:N-acyl-D-amino-acid deacylase